MRRRWGFLFLLALALGAVLLSLCFWLRSAAVNRWLLSRLTALYDGEFHSTLHVDRLQVDLLSFSVEARGVAISEPGGGSSPAAIRIERVRVSFSPLPLLSGTVHLRSVLLERPQVRLRIDKTGADNLSPLFQSRHPSPGPPRWNLFAEQVRVEDGVLNFSDPSAGVSAQAGKLEVQGSLDLAARLLSGRFRQSGGELRLAGLRAPLTHLEGEVAWLGGKKEIKIEALHLESPGMTAAGAGTLTFGNVPSLAASFEARVHPEKLSTWWPRAASVPLRGSYAVKGNVAGKWDGLRASGEANGSGITVAGVPVARASLRWRWSSPRLSVRRFHVALGGGDLDGQGEIEFSAAGSPSYHGEARWQAVAMEKLFPYLPLGGFRNLNGFTSGQAAFLGGGETGPGLHRVAGRVAVKAAGDGARKMGIPPLTLDAAVVFSGDRFQISQAVLTSQGLTIQPQGELTLNGAVNLPFSFHGIYRPDWSSYLGWEGKAQEVNGRGRLSGSWDRAVLEVSAKLAAGEIAGLSFSHLQFSGRWQGTSLQVDEFHVDNPGGNLEGKGRLLVAGNLFGRKPSPFLREIPALDLSFSGVEIPYLRRVFKTSWPVGGDLNGSFTMRGTTRQLRGKGEIEWVRGRWGDVEIPEVRAAVTLSSLRPAAGGSARVVLQSSSGEVSGFGYRRFSADLSVVAKDRFRTGSVQGSVEVAGGRTDRGGPAAFSRLLLQGAAAVDASSSQTLVSGQGTLRVGSGSWRGEPFSSLQASLRLATAREFSVEGLTLVLPAGTVRGNGHYRWGRGEWGGELNTPALDLAKIQALVSQGSQPGGVALFHLRGSGGREGINLDGGLQLSGLHLWRQNLGDGKISVQGRGQEVQLTGDGFGGYRIQGGLRLAGEYPFRLSVSAAQSNLAAFLQQVTGGRAGGITEELQGAFAGEATVTGNLRPQPQISGRLRLDRLTASLYGVKVSNAGPIELAYQAGKVEVSHFQLQGDGTNLSVSGTISTAGEMKLAVKGQGGLSLLAEQVPGVRISRGEVEGDVRVGGSLSSPSIAGAVHLRQGAFTVGALGESVADLSADGEFSAERLQFYRFQGRLETGGTFHGSAEYQIAGKGKGNFRVILDGSQLALHYPAGLSSRIDVQLLMEAGPGGKVLSGQVVVDHAVYHREIDLRSLLFQLRQRRLEPFGEQGQLDLRVEITSREGILIDTNLGRMEMGADLILSGNLQHPRLTGRAEVDKGEIIFRGTKFVVSSGTVDFFNPSRFVPYFDLVARATVKSYRVTLSVNGTPDQFNVNLSSDPPLSEVDLVSLITTGQTGSQTSPGAEVAARGASTYLAGELGKEFEKGVRQITGLDRFQVDPYVVDSTQGSGPRVTVGKDLSKDLSVTYSSIVGGTGTQVFQVEYRLTRSLSLVGVRDEIGNTGVDLKFSFRFR